MTDFPPPDMTALAAYWHGAWHFTRTIWEGSEAPQADASGVAVFEAGTLPAQWIYREHGQLRLLAAADSRPIVFTRVFDYRFMDERLAVLFADGERSGQPYQDYLLRGHLLAPAADHLCGPDCYNAAYTLDAADRFTMETFINGPRKRTRVLTRYQRQHARAVGLSVSPA